MFLLNIRENSIREVKIMEDRWTVSSVNGQKNGQEGEWTSLDQIQGMQTLLRDNIFGISFRIIKKSGGKFMPENDILTAREARKNNDAIRYAISEISINSLNPYYRILEDSGVDMHRVFDIIKQKLNEGTWSCTNVKGLMDYGVVEGINTKMILEDNDNKTRSSEAFRADEDIETMRKIGWDEYYYRENRTPKEFLQFAKEKIDMSKDWALVYKKYEKIVKEEEKQQNSGATSILEFMKRNGLSVQDLSLALAMAQATKTGVLEAEGHIIDENTKQTQEKDGHTQAE